MENTTDRMLTVGSKLDIADSINEVDSWFEDCRKIANRLNITYSVDKKPIV